MKYALYWVWLSLIWMFAGCNTPGVYYPPVSVTPSFMGLGSVKVDMGGYTVPAKVVPTAVVVAPTLLVPSTSPAANELTATVAPTANTPATAVAVVVAPVATETLAIPIKAQ